MIKLVALEKIYGMATKTTYAEKHEEVVFVKDHCDEYAVYLNERINQKFIAKKAMVGEIEQAAIISFVEQKTKKINNSRRTKTDDKNQMEIF